MRVLAKIKKIHQQFSETVNQGGLSSGSSKVVISNFDLLMQIYGGSSAVEALSYGVSSTQELLDSDVILGGEDVNFNRRRRSECSETEYEDADENEETPDQNPVVTVNSAPVPAPVPTPATKRPLAPAAAIPRLIDNKRKHMEKSLSAAQRD